MIKLVSSRKAKRSGPNKFFYVFLSVFKKTYRKIFTRRERYDIRKEHTKHFW